MCEIDCYDLCWVHRDLARGQHTDWDDRVCDWAAWMFQHDTACEGCE